MYTSIKFNKKYSFIMCILDEKRDIRDTQMPRVHKNHVSLDVPQELINQKNIESNSF